MYLKRVFSFLLAALLATQVYADSIITGSKPYTFIPGTVISSSQVNADFDYIISQVNTNAAKNGVNSSITALLGLTTPIAPSFGGSSIYTSGAAGGTANAITVSSTQPAVSSYSLTTGNFVLFIASATNTGATTLDVNVTGATAINKVGAGGLIALTGGEIVNGTPTLVYYDGTRYVIINQVPLFGVEQAVASAATTDLTTSGSHNVSITGTTTITSFGSNASTGAPLYYVKFADVLTLTYNATSLITPGGADILTGAGDSAIVEYLGSGNWRINSYTEKVNPPSLEIVNSLVIINNATTPTTQIDVDADNSIICNTTGYCIKTGAVNLTINAATTGANGLDAGSLANNTWYYIYIISNGTTTAGLMSTSATAPTMPTGYVYKYKVGARRTAGAATFTRVKQVGNRAQYVVVAASTTPNLPIMANGSSGSIAVPTWTSVSTSNYVPTTAVRILGATESTSSTSTMVAPNNSYGNSTSGSNPPYAVSSYAAACNNCDVSFDMVLESTNIFWASNGAGNLLKAYGWIDAVNAN